MYKQECVGSKGPLLPAVVLFSCALILFSITDACVRVFRLSPWTFTIWLAVVLFLVAMVWRYTQVKIAYVWFGGELVIRRSDSIEEYRLVIPAEDMIGLCDRCGTIGKCRRNQFARNCCATLRGRTLECCTIFYHDSCGQVMKIRLQPSSELRKMIAAEIEGTQKA